jgi:hypothetical protein
VTAHRPRVVRVVRVIRVIRVVRVVRVVGVSAADGAAKGPTDTVEGDEGDQYPWYQERWNVNRNGEDLHDPQIRQYQGLSSAGGVHLDVDTAVWMYGSKTREYPRTHVHHPVGGRNDPSELPAIPRNVGVADIEPNGGRDTGRMVDSLPMVPS